MLLALPRAEVRDQRDQRHEQGDDDKADDAAQRNDQERLHQGSEAFGEHGHFFVEGVRHFVKHRVQLARLLAHVDHVDHHVVEDRSASGDRRGAARPGPATTDCPDQKGPRPTDWRSLG